ncbi:MAG: hypothetical protein AAF808_09795 [Cyanobacteria bacterium P01_D01_bin.2]
MTRHRRALGPDLKLLTYEPTGAIITVTTTLSNVIANLQTTDSK